MKECATKTTMETRFVFVLQDTVEFNANMVSICQYVRSLEYYSVSVCFILYSDVEIFLKYYMLKFLDICSPNPCYNGGTCNVEHGKVVCSCPKGYNGTHCETSKSRL